MSAIVSDLHVVRIAGLSADHLDIVRHLESRLILDLESCRASLVELRRKAADELYSIVPTLDRVERRTALALRRRAHSDDLERIATDAASFLSRDVADRLGDAELLHDELRLRVESAIALDEEATTMMIRRALGTADVRDALHLLSPGFLELSVRSAFAVGTRHARTALSYMGRAALKPSPLSSLTSIGVPGEAAASRRIDVSSLFMYRVVQSFVDNPALIKTLDFKPAYAHDGHVVIRRVVEAHGSAWLEEDVVSLVPYQSEYSRLEGWPGGDFNSLAVLAGGNPCARIARWVKLGLVQVVLPGRPGEHAHIALANHLEAVSANETARALTRMLRSLEANLDSAHSIDGNRRAELARARVMLDQIGQELHVREQTPRLLNEDTARPCPRVSPGTDARLRRWGDRVRSDLSRSHRYDAIVRRFEQEFGSDASCRDAAAFFIAAQASPQFRDEMRDAWSADRTWIEQGSVERSFLPVGITNAPPSLGVMYQEVGAQNGDGGDLVINQLVNGVGGIVARFAAIGGATGARVRADLLSWIDGMFPEVVTKLAFHPSSEVNPLQGAARGILPAVEWPTDPRRNDREFTFEHVGLKHDSSRGVLDFVDREGAPVAIVHLGIVPSWSIAGARGLALTVMDPWIDGTALNLDSNPIARARTAHEEPSHRPRIHDEGLIVRRETWMVEVADLPLPGESETTADFVCRFDRWRRGRGIPVEAFGLAISSTGFASEARKPLWLNMLSPHSLHATLPLLRDGTYVRFQEVLPSRQKRGERVREHLRLLRWGRTDHE